MPGLLRVEDHLPAVHSLKKAGTEYVGCFMVGYVPDPTIESEWRGLLEAVAKSAHSWQGGGGYEIERGEGNAKGPAGKGCGVWEDQERGSQVDDRG